MNRFLSIAYSYYLGLLEISNMLKTSLRESIMASNCLSESILPED